MTAEPGTEGTDVREPIVSCDSCGNPVGESAITPVPRTYYGRVFQEQWCLLCVNSLDEATERAKRMTSGDEPEY